MTEIRTYQARQGSRAPHALALAVGVELVRALSFAGGMAWEILWALSLGFALSALVQAVGSTREMRYPPDSQQLPPLHGWRMAASYSSASTPRWWPPAMPSSSCAKASGS